MKIAVIGCAGIKIPIEFSKAEVVYLNSIDDIDGLNVDMVITEGAEREKSHEYIKIPIDFEMPVIERFNYMSRNGKGLKAKTWDKKRYQ